jgi:putative nucleotidyltransferase with HDIG domain
VAAPDTGRPSPPHEELARRLVGSARDVDAVANLDGGRFAVLLPNVDTEDAAALAERLRLAVAGRPFDGTEGPAVATVSVGLAVWREGDSPSAPVERCERALGAASVLGGNQFRDDEDPVLDGGPVEPEQLERLAELVDAREGRHGHARAVASLAGRLATELGLVERSVSTISLAGLLHDLGKLAVPEVVLRKPGTLDESEWAEVERHPTLGADLVVRLTRELDVAEIVRAHHEHWDGSGYPHHLRDHAIPFEARILAVAHAFVAMTNDRPYREARSETSALTTIWRESGSRYDPTVVSALLALGRAGLLTAEPDRATEPLVVTGWR